MNKAEKDKLIEHIIENVSKTIKRSEEDIVKAYSTLFDDGGVPLTIKATLRGNMEEIKTTYSLSFPKDKVKISYKTIFNVKQGELFDGNPASETPAAPAKKPPPAAETSKANDPPGMGETEPTVIIAPNADFKISVGVMSIDEGDFRWFSEIDLPKGGEAFSGTFESEEDYKSQGDAEFGGLSHALLQVDACLIKKSVVPPKTAKIEKGRKALFDAIEKIRAGEIKGTVKS